MIGKTVAMDIETESLDPKYIWVICAEDVETGEREQFCNLTTIPEEKERFVEYCKDIDSFVFHNGLGFDVPVINRLLGQVIDPQKVIDLGSAGRDLCPRTGHVTQHWNVQVYFDT